MMVDAAQSKVAARHACIPGQICCSRVSNSHARFEAECQVWGEVTYFLGSDLPSGCSVCPSLVISPWTLHQAQGELCTGVQDSLL